MINRLRVCNLDFLPDGSQYWGQPERNPGHGTYFTLHQLWGQFFAFYGAWDWVGRKCYLPAQITGILKTFEEKVN